MGMNMTLEAEWTMEGGELPFQKSLYSTAYRFTGDPQTAEDLVQETYMKAFRYTGNSRKAPTSGPGFSRY